MTIDTLKLSDKKDDPSIAAAIEKWEKEVKRYASEPDKGEGRKELAERAKIAEHEREEASHRYHSLEIAVGMLQVAIVLASASVLTGILALAWLSGGLGLTAAGIAAYATVIGGHLL